MIGNVIRAKKRSENSFFICFFIDICFRFCPYENLGNENFVVYMFSVYYE